MKKQYTTIYIGNLRYSRDERGLRELFNDYGPIKAIDIIVDPKTEKSKGYAFVTMLRKKDALDAIEELDGQELDGRTLKVSIAKEREQKKVVKKAPVSEKPLKKKSVASRKKKGNLDQLFDYLKSKK